jgi:hypothetical protein
VGTISSYYVELRAPLGLDTRLADAARLRGGRRRGARREPHGQHQLAHRHHARYNELPRRGPRRRETFADPGRQRPEDHVVSADATKAVDQGGARRHAGHGRARQRHCADDSAFTAPGPDTCQSPGPTGTGGAAARCGAGAARWHGRRRRWGGGTPDATPGGRHRTRRHAPRRTPRAPGTPPPRRRPTRARPPPTPAAKIISSGCSCHVGGQQTRSRSGPRLALLWFVAAAVV